MFLTGGLANPFALLFLAPVLISATALSPRTTILLGVLALLSFPVGTALGIYALWTLLRRPQTAQPGV